MISTILVPTDYSNESLNAVDYAVAIARLNNAKVILLHVFQIPANFYNFPQTYTKEKLRTDTISNLEIIRETIYQKYCDVVIECEVRYGPAEEEINNYLKLNNVDLLVMGMKNNGYIAKKLFGGVIPFSLFEVQHPVLVIENGIKLKRVVLAYKNVKITNENANESFKEVVLQYKSRIYLLKIMSEYKYAAIRRKEAEASAQQYSPTENEYPFFNAISENVINFKGNFLVKMATSPVASQIYGISQEKVYIRNPKTNN